jgi:hypothetical protein
VLADILRWEGLTVTEAQDLDTVRSVALTASTSAGRASPVGPRLDEELVESGIPVGGLPLPLSSHHVIKRSGAVRPVSMRRVNGLVTNFWIAMILVSLATGWVESVV